MFLVTLSSHFSYLLQYNKLFYSALHLKKAKHEHKHAANYKTSKSTLLYINLRLTFNKIYYILALAAFPLGAGFCQDSHSLRKQTTLY